MKMFTIRTKMASPIPNESEKMMLLILVHGHDFPDFIGVAWVPGWYCVDPQKLESKVEKPVGRHKCGLVGGSRGRSRMESPFATVQCVMGGVCTALS